MEAGDLVAAAPDALFACTAPLARALVRATQSIPIVFTWVADPVRAGLAQSYARPGANATGVANRYYELAKKRVEVLRELLPSARRVSVVAGVFDETMESTLHHARSAASRVGLELSEARTCAVWTAALGESLAANADAIMAITPFAALGMRWTSEELARFANARRLPVVFSDLESMELGGLISYGNSFVGDVRQAAELLARVLEGARPADMPVQLAARFELAVNLNTARAIGIEVPQSILLRADKVIE
jgi:putative ABC transport system substrate-binding protein